MDVGVRSEVVVWSSLFGMFMAIALEFGTGELLPAPPTRRIQKRKNVEEVVGKEVSHDLRSTKPKCIRIGISLQ